MQRLPSGAHSSHSTQRGSHGLRSVRIALVSLVVTACTALTSVDAPDILGPAALGTPVGAAALRAGAIGEFTSAFAGRSGTASGQVAITGAMADEFSAALPGTSLSDADLRIVNEPSSAYPYAQFQRARVNAANAIEALQKYSPGKRAQVGELFALIGYTEVLLAENVCSGIPLGGVRDGTPVYGTPLTTNELLQRATQDFDSALVYGADSIRIANLARVGVGRALLDLAEYDSAAAAVSSVATSFRYVTSQTATIQPNGVFESINTSLFLTVSNQEGENGLDFRSANDPRVQTRLIGKGADRTTDVYGLVSYGSTASPIVLASGVEARLIEAESELNAGRSPEAFSALNALRATVPGLAPLSPASTAQSQVDQLFRERAFWLFATGHRHGDLRRLVRQYGRPRESVFPTGIHATGLAYGTDVTFPADFQELNNPSYRQCASREP